MEPLNESRTPPMVRRETANLNVWKVRLPGATERQIVLRELRPAGGYILYCSCQGAEVPDAADGAPEGANCGHSRAVAAVFQHQCDLAALRRARGLSYTGMRVAARPSLAGGGALTTTQVLVREGDETQPLDPRASQQLRNHSPDGFSWGYAGSGPALLALSILLDYTGDENMALGRYQAFKQEIIAALPQEATHWEIQAARIERFLAADGPLVDTAATADRSAPMAPDKPLVS